MCVAGMLPTTPTAFKVADSAATGFRPHATSCTAGVCLKSLAPCRSKLANETSCLQRRRAVSLCLHKQIDCAVDIEIAKRKSQASL